MPRAPQSFWVALVASLALAAHGFAPLGSTALGVRRGGSAARPPLARRNAPTATTAAAVPAAASAASESVTKPKGASNAWEVHKFGGASLADAALYRTVGDLLIEEARGRGGASGGMVPTMAVVSARAGMTDLLVKVVDSALTNFAAATADLDAAVASQLQLLRELAPPHIAAPVEAAILQDAKDILSVVQSLRMINSVPPVTMEVVTGFGEIWSAQTLHAYLQTQGVPTAWLDARQVLVVKSDSNNGLGEKGAASTGGVVPLWDQTAAKLATWWNTVGVANGLHSCSYAGNQAPVVVVTGFVATTATGVPTTLKRSGSDYSATIFAKLCGAGRVTMWKNTNGVYTADPRRVPEAFPIASLKYDEAMELAYFGAQVLHPSAMVPCIDDNIPVYVRNIFNPSFEGTVIQGRSSTLKQVNTDFVAKSWRSRNGEIPIKGITSVDQTALVTLEGVSSLGGVKVAERFMGAMADNNINVLIITQASSESSICVAVPENQGDAALAALQEAFELELARSTINSVNLVKGMAVVAIVGEGMAFTAGVASTFMASLATANVNIRLISQGSSERQIAVVVNAQDATRALRAVHMAFTLSETAASVTILGASGALGASLVQQLRDTQDQLASNLGVRFNVVQAANSKRMVVCPDSRGLSLGGDALLAALRSTPGGDAPSGGEGFGGVALPTDFEALTEAMEADVNPHRVVIDCTNSDAVGAFYERWLKAGINVISPSRKLSAGPMANLLRVKEAMRASNANWQFESAVGSALPVLTTLRDLRETGDDVHAIRGCVSGTMAYVLRTMQDDGASFSQAVQQAMDRGFTENDVREDLCGIDTARKVVILARAVGLALEVGDVSVESLLPPPLAAKDYGSDLSEAKEQQLLDLAALDGAMAAKLAEVAADCELRYEFRIDVATQKCSVKLVAVDTTSPLFRLKANENLVAFETARYGTNSPLIIKGAAAGPELAAAGIFADLLRLARAFSANQN